MRTYLLFVFFALGIWSCDEEGFKTYDSGNYCQFAEEVEDSTSISFFFYPGKDVVEYPIVVELAGKPSSTALTYKIVVDNVSSAVEGTHVELPEVMEFEPYQVVDTCWIKLLRASDLTTSEKRLILRVESSQAVQPGAELNTTAIIRVSDMIPSEAPSWFWKSYFGDYSVKKFQLFIEVTGQTDLTDVSRNLWRIYALQLRYYLEEQKAQGKTIYEEDGSEMTVPLG